MRRLPAGLGGRDPERAERMARSLPGEDDRAARRAADPAVEPLIAYGADEVLAEVVRDMVKEADEHSAQAG
ncbi:hypothetical protein GCM10015535_17590 [Streptomyces gelaticus]|uniref:Polyprenyl synthetase family protein n=1 Tax=Streptomyces gelaticus TaxID=285446 RepID=A0ABQ2VYB1_9ACTN|nr:hypothetical protein [Streptomyces gelaticus]GGV79986.1 hypothetical protein GCM10015535_17590 [Streptomyces gelaticus]